MKAQNAKLYVLDVRSVYLSEICPILECQCFSAEMRQKKMALIENSFIKKKKKRQDTRSPGKWLNE